MRRGSKRFLGEYSVSLYPRPPDIVHAPLPIGVYVISTASYSGTRKSIWDHYNDMAREVDTLREIELTELTDTVLVFVTSTLLFHSIVLTVVSGRIVCCLSLCLPTFHYHPTPTGQRRNLKRDLAPHIPSAQQFLRSRICRARVLRPFECGSRQHSPFCEFGSRPRRRLSGGVDKKLATRL